MESDLIFILSYGPLHFHMYPVIKGTQVKIKLAWLSGNRIKKTVAAMGTSVF